jgi:transposase-like protein
MANYTDEQRATVRHLLNVLDGNVKAASRESGLPEQTVRDWKKKWEREGTPESVALAVPEAAEAFTTNVKRVRDKALDKLETAVENDQLKGRDLIIAVGVLTDKARVSEGKPTSQVEHSGAAGSLPIAEVRELFAGMARGMVEAAQNRATTISSAFAGEEPIEAEFTEQVEDEDLLALPSAVSE